MVVVRPGLYREVVAGAAWALLRAEGRCMAAWELQRRLEALGMRLEYDRVVKALREYNGTLFKRVRTGNHVLYCAMEV